MVGSDSSATFTAGTLRLIEQPVKKIRIINDRYILAGTGSVGLGQRFCHEIEQFLSVSTNRALAPVELCRQLSQKAILNFGSTNVQSNEFGALLAFPSGEKSHLCEFDTNRMQPELKTDHIWYVSMGSGQVLTDPFLGFMRKLLWNSGKPSLEEGIFATYWCLQHAIEVNAGGINGPIDIAVLKNEGGKPIAKYLSPEELQGYGDSVKELEKHISIFKFLQPQDTTPEIPKL